MLSFKAGLSAPVCIRYWIDFLLISLLEKIATNKFAIKLPIFTAKLI